MKIYLDSCDVEAIRKYKELGIVDGVTTNPSIIAKSGRDLKTVITEICEIIDTSVSVEVMSTEYKAMLAEAESLVDIAPQQITIKLPIMEDGLRACKSLAEKSVAVNMTLCFSPTQALLVAKAGATYVSPFIGRLDDIGRDGLGLIADICAIYGNYPDISTQILAASIRNPIHIIEVAKLGVDVVTLPPKLIPAMIHNPLTEKGLSIFLNDWNNVGIQNRVDKKV